MTPHNIKLVQQIKGKIRNLKSLELPPPSSYLIIESKGLLGSWGAVLKHRPTIFSIKEEKINKYDNGTYQTKVIATGDEVIAVIKAMKNLTVHNLRKKLTLRTDCQAIVAFYNKKLKSILSKRKWLKYIHYIKGNGFQVTILYIKGNNNFLAD